MSNGQELLTNLEQTKEQFSEVGDKENQLVGQTKAMQAATAEMHIAWMDIVTTAAPALIVVLKGVAENLAYIAYMAQTATAAIQSLFNVAGQLGGVMQGVAKMAPGGGDIGSQADIAQGWDQVGQSIKAAGDQANNFSDIAQKLDKEFLETRTRIWSDQAKAYTDSLKNARTAKAPPANIPKGGGGGKEKADPMEGMELALEKDDQEMVKFNTEVAKLGSESQMAAKASQESFATLSARAQQDYLAMKEKYKEFTDAVESGSKTAAKQAETDWEVAAKKFQQDWEGNVVASFSAMFGRSNSLLSVGQLPVKRSPQSALFGFGSAFWQLGDDLLDRHGLLLLELQRDRKDRGFA